MLRRRNKRIVTTILFAGLLVIFAVVGTAFADSHLDPEPLGPSTLLSGPFIEMQVSGLPTGPDGIWTTIEWQDPYTGEWTTVDGWQGTVETDGTQLWWVDGDDYGSGPFRWLAFDEEGGEQVGLSDNFNLPESRIDVVVVQMQPLGQD